MLLVYPAIFHKEDGAYWVEFPDLEGCNTFGDTLTETVANAKEALEGYCLTVLESGMPLKAPSEISSLKTAGENDFVSLIDCEIKKSSKRAVKKTLTIPYWLNERATEKNINFSAVLQNALIEQLQIQNSH